MPSHFAGNKFFHTYPREKMKLKLLLWFSYKIHEEMIVCAMPEIILEVEVRLSMLAPQMTDTPFKDDTLENYVCYLQMFIGHIVELKLAK